MFCMFVFLWKRLYFGEVCILMGILWWCIQEICIFWWFGVYWWGGELNFYFYFKGILKEYVLCNAGVYVFRCIDMFFCVLVNFYFLLIVSDIVVVGDFG